MTYLKFFTSLLILPVLLYAQYTGGSGDGFFVWTSQADISLPVELFSHEEIISPTGIKLKWETASELENLGFILNRRINDETFKQISSYQLNKNLKGAGNSATGQSYEFTDGQVLPNRKYTYQVVSVNFSGHKEIVFQTTQLTFTVADMAEIPAGFEIFRNYPNPFNPNTKIVFKNEKDSKVKISVFTVSGERVAVLADRIFSAGRHELNFIPNAYQSSQIYICRIESASIIKHFKMTFAK